MSDWRFGDKAVCVEGCKLEHDPTPFPCYGLVATVTGVGRERIGKDLRLVLMFQGYPGIHCAGCFLKITPDKHEQCEPEFVTLLKRSKRKVEA